VTTGTCESEFELVARVDFRATADFSPGRRYVRETCTKGDMRTVGALTPVDFLQRTYRTGDDRRSEPRGTRPDFCLTGADGRQGFLQSLNRHYGLRKLARKTENDRLSDLRIFWYQRATPFLKPPDNLLDEDLRDRGTGRHPHRRRA
jgi:hypothetical protein